MLSKIKLKKCKLWGWPPPPLLEKVYILIYFFFEGFPYLVFDFLSDQKGALCPGAQTYQHVTASLHAGTYQSKLLPKRAKNQADDGAVEESLFDENRHVKRTLLMRYNIIILLHALDFRLKRVEQHIKCQERLKAALDTSWSSELQDLISSDHMFEIDKHGLSKWTFLKSSGQSFWKYKKLYICIYLCLDITTVGHKYRLVVNYL